MVAETTRASWWLSVLDETLLPFVEQHTFTVYSSTMSHKIKYISQSFGFCGGVTVTCGQFVVNREHINPKHEKAMWWAALNTS